MRPWIGCILLLVAACSPSDSIVPSKSDSDSASGLVETDVSQPSASLEENALIRTYLSSLGTKKVIFVLDTIALKPDDTALISDYKTTSKSEFFAHRSALTHLSLVSLVSRKLDVASFDDLSYVFASQEELENARKELPAIERFSSIAGHTVVSVSQVGIDSTATFAILYVTHNCGLRCGVGFQVTYKKNQEKWVEIHKRQLWVA